MTASLLARAALWYTYRGFAKGDEVELLEAPLHYGVGVDHVPWEIRNLTLPLLVLATLLLGAAKVSMVEKRSMAALDAARRLARSDVGAVALSQSWAYGNSLFLEGREVLELGLPPSERRLRELPRRVGAVGLYAESLERAPELHRILTRLDFRRTEELRRSRSEAVVLYERP